MDAAAWAVIAGVVATFAATVTGFIYTWKKDGRERKWIKEDAAEKAAHLASKIDVSATAAADAYREANAVNKKIQDLAAEVAKLARRQRKRRRKS